MNLKHFRPILEIVAFSVVAFLIHWSVFYFLLPFAEPRFQYPLELIYSFFTACAIVITAVSIVVKHFNIDSVGQTFMLTTGIEMLLCFVLFYPNLNGENVNAGFERGNFILVFLLFLAVETIVTIRLLNKKQ
jgi:hypothetical protein